MSASPPANRNLDNKGWIAPSKQKHSDRSPDMRGKARFEGNEFYISGWWREKDGERILSIALSPVTQENSSASRSSAPAPAARQPTPSAAPSSPAVSNSGLDDLGLGDLFGQQQG